MPHPTSTALPYEGQLPIRLVLKFLLYAALGAFLIVAQSLALLITVGLGLALVLAIQERVRKLDARSVAPTHPFAAGWVGDGGAFPGREPEDRSSTPCPRVIDGGSLEHHRR